MGGGHGYDTTRSEEHDEGDRRTHQRDPLVPPGERTEPGLGADQVSRVALKAKHRPEQQQETFP
jgi:hypothetical protein